MLSLLVCSFATWMPCGSNTAQPPAPFAPESPPEYLTVASTGSYTPGSLHSSTIARDADEDDWDFSYTFIEAGATRSDLDEIDDTADTYYGLASLDLFEFIYIFLGYENSSIDFDNTETDRWTAGAGVHFDVARNLDLLADLGFLYTDLSADSISDTSSNGHRLRAGARWLPVRFGEGGLELSGRGIWIDTGSDYFGDDRSVGFDLGVRVHFLRHLSVGAGYEKLEDADSGSLNARFSF
jgi:hypothetical protein